jgi:hypothetical protein
MATAAFVPDDENDSVAGWHDAVRDEVVVLAGTFPEAFPIGFDETSDIEDDADAAFTIVEDLVRKRKRVLGLTLSILSIAQNARRRQRLPPVLVVPQDWGQYRAEKIERGTNDSVMRAYHLFILLLSGLEQLEHFVV